MKTHKLKIDRKYFIEMQIGKMLFNVRKDDRGYETGDICIMQETLYSAKEMDVGQPLKYTGRELTVEITSIMQGYPIDDGYCAFSCNKLLRHSNG